jgi:hypothetical protein
MYLVFHCKLSEFRMAIFLKSAAELLRLYKYVKTNSLFSRNI